MKQPSINKLVVGLVVLGCVIATILCGCQSLPTGEIQVRVVATLDFGNQLMLDELVTIDSGASAMDALMQVVEVETAYGGGFVNAINSVRSGYTGSHPTKEDWFFYINGISANTGALDYTLHPGDIEHWDFHNWDFRQFVPAIIGDFPEPFLHGYGGVVYPTVIAYQDGWEEDAEQIAYSLSQLGVASVSTTSISELQADEKESSNLILLGTTDCQPIEELNQVWDRLGFYIHFKDDSQQVFNWKGELAVEYGAGVGVIQATQSPWNPKGIGVCENVIWIVSGLDEAGVKNAVVTLVNHHNDFQYACAVVIAGGEIIKVP